MLRIISLVSVALVLTNGLPQQIRIPEKFDVYPSLNPGAAENLYFVLSATNLPSKDANSGVADPYVKVYTGSIKHGSDLDKLGESETLINENNPKWVKVFKVQYRKRTNQKLWVEVSDHDPINPDDSIGEAFIDLDEYVEMGMHLTVPIKGTKEGSITIQNTAPFLFSLELKDIPYLDEFGGFSDPYIKCYFRYGKEGKDIKFFETSTINNVNNAVWETPIAFDNFQRGTDQYFHFKIKDHDSITADDDIGDAFMAVEPFVDKKMRSVLPVLSTKNTTLIVNYVQ